ncbi:MAG: fatty acid desaturase family protein [Pirellulaceae bacterium]
MPVNSDAPRRTEKELHAATRPFEESSLFLSWWYVGSTFVCLLGAVLLAGIIPWWPLRLVFSILAGLLFVRAFIVFHDSLHNAIARGSRPARVLLHLYGLLALTPPWGWRHTHNFHHAHVGKPVPSRDGNFALMTSDIGSFPLMTIDAWRRATKLERLRYRISRHPITILGAYATVFFLSLCFVPLVRNPRKNWDCAVSIVLHTAMVSTVWWAFGFSVVAFTLLIPFVISAALGAYLFFAQHNFPGMRIVPVGEWTHCRGALESSSYLQCSPIMAWFTGNIGYHHVHHLNALIPFYRLPEAMAAIPELQHPIVTSFHPRDVLACLRLNLWDLNEQRLVSFRDAARRAG